MDEIDIPQYFLCPISLQIMKDPVTTVTGITYDRENIERWLITADEELITAVCPVTKQPLPRGSDLTPNHMLRRLIQAWCTANPKSGIDRIPTPKCVVHRSTVLKLIRESRNDNSLLRVDAMKKIEELANESDKNRKCMAEAGVAKAMILFVLRCFREVKSLQPGLEEALRTLQLTWNWNPTTENDQIINMDLIQSLLWILNNTDAANIVKTHALIVLKNVAQVANSTLLESLKLEFFKQMVSILRHNKCPQAINAALNILIRTCPLGRNKINIIEAGAIFELIEIELSGPDKKITELVFCLLANLCSCADGRQEMLKHAGGMAVVAKRLLRVSPSTDESALCVIESIARFSATREVVVEMLRVSVVSKLCMVIQADCTDYLKKKAREILRLHSSAWSNSPCIQLYLLTRYK